MSGRLFYSILICISFVLSCVNDSRNTSNLNESEIAPITIDPSDTEVFKVSDIFTEVMYLALQSPEGIHFGEINHMEIWDGKIFILDNYRTRNLTVFDMSGKFLHQFSSTGRGPGEFLSPRSFSLDIPRNRIGIYCNASMKVVYFDIKTYEYIVEKRIDFYSSLYFSSDDNFVFFNNNLMVNPINGIYYDVFVFNDEFDIQAQYFEIPMNRKGTHYSIGGVHRSYSRSGDWDTYFTRPFDYNVYSAKDGGLVVVDRYDFGELNIKEDFFEKEYIDSDQKTDNFNKYITVLSRYYRIGDTIFLNYLHGLVSYYYIQSGDGKVRHLKRKDLIADVDYYNTSNILAVTKDNQFVWYNEPSYLHRHLREKEAALSPDEWAEYQRVNRDLIEFSKTVSSNDNPYLIFTKLAI